MSEAPIEGQFVKTPTGRTARVLRVDDERGEVVVQRLDDGDLVSLRICHLRPHQEAEA